MTALSVAGNRTGFQVPCQHVQCCKRDCSTETSVLGHKLTLIRTRPWCTTLQNAVISLPPRPLKLRHQGPRAVSSQSHHSWPEEPAEPQKVPFESEDGVALLVSMLGAEHAKQEREEAASALWQQSFDSREKLERIGHLPGCIPLLIDMLKAESARAAASAAGLLRNLSRLEHFRLEIAKRGGLEGLAALLEAKATPAPVREQAVGALNELSRGREEAERLAAIGGVAPSLQSLDSAMEEERLAAAGLVANLARVESVRDKLEEAGAIPKLLKLLTDVETEYSQLVRSAAGAAMGKLVNPLVRLLETAEGEERLAAAAVLTDMAREKNQREAILASGAVTKLLTVLEQDESGRDEAMRDVARQVIGELKLLAAPGGSGAPRPIEEGYVGLFVRMLGLDRPVEEREEAALALWHHVLQSREKLDEVGELHGAFPLLIQLMREKERPLAAEAAAGVLRALATVDAYRFRLYEAGAIEGVIALLQQWRHEAPDVRKEALGLLQNLSLGTKESAQIVASQGAELCVALLDLSFPPVELAFDPANPLTFLPQKWQRLIDEEEVASVLSILANLAASEGNREPIASAGAIPRLAKLLSGEHAPAVLRSRAKSVLAELSKQSALKPRFVDEGLVPVPLIKARYFSTVAKGLEDGQSARLAALESKSKYKVLPRKEGVARLVLMLGLGDPEPVAAAADEIRDFAVTAQNRQDLSRAGAVPMLVRLLASEAPSESSDGSGKRRGREEQAKTYPEVARAAANALANLCQSRDVRRKVEKVAGVEALAWLLKTGGGSQKAAAARALFWLMRDEDGSSAPEEPRLPGSLDGLIDLIAAGKEAEGPTGKDKPPPLSKTGKLLAAGGLPSLAELLGEAPPKTSEKAASILFRVVKEEKGALAAVEAGVVPALERLFDAGAKAASLPDADGPLGEDILSRQQWAARAAGAGLVASLANHDATLGALKGSKLHSLLSTLLSAPDASLEAKEAISEALLALEQREDLPTVGPSDETEREIVVNVEIPRLLTAMEGSSPVAEREHAVHELSHIVKSSSDQEAYLAAIASNGGIFLLVDMLKECSEKCAREALGILDMLTLDEGNHLVMVEAGAEDILERIARSTSEHWNLALRVLRRLPV